jgi:hypothetical protein
MKDRLVLLGFKRVHREMMHQFWALRTKGHTAWARSHGGKLWDPKSPGHSSFIHGYTMIDKVSKDRNGKLTALYADPCGMFVGYAASTIGHNSAWTLRLRKAAFKYAYRHILNWASVKLRKKVSTKSNLMYSLFILNKLMILEGAAKQLHYHKKAAKLGQLGKLMLLRAKRIYRQNIRDKKCRLCKFFSLAHYSSLAEKLARGKLPKEIHSDDLFNMNTGIEVLERSNFHFNNAFDMGFGMSDFVRYIRHFKPMLKRGTLKADTVGRLPGQRGGPLDRKRWTDARSVWRSGRWSNSNMPAFRCVAPWYCRVVMSRTYVMTHLPFMLDYDDTSHLRRKDAKWIFDWFDKYLPSLLRGRSLEVASEMVSSFRSSGKKEHNSQEVCWGTTMAMSMHRGNGRWRPLALNGMAGTGFGESYPHNLNYGRFHWIWEALDAMRDRIGIDKPYESHVHKILTRAHFSKQAHSAIYDHSSWRAKVRGAWKYAKKHHAKRDFACNLYYRLRKMRNGKMHRRSFLKLEPAEQTATTAFTRMKSRSQRSRFLKLWAMRCMRAGPKRAQAFLSGRYFRQQDRHFRQKRRKAKQLVRRQQRT